MPSDTAVLLRSAAGEIAIVAIHFAENDLDAADQQIDVLLVSSDLQIVNVLGEKQER